MIKLVRNKIYSSSQNRAHITKMVNLLFLLYNYGRKMIMKAKGINVVETKIGTMLGEINPETQTNSRKLLAAR